MNDESKYQIESIVEHFCSEFSDAYQCHDWEMDAYDFCGLLLKESFKAMFQMAHELDEDTRKDNNNDE